METNKQLHRYLFLTYKQLFGNHHASFGLFKKIIGMQAIFSSWRGTDISGEKRGREIFSANVIHVDKWHSFPDLRQ